MQPEISGDDFMNPPINIERKSKVVVDTPFGSGISQKSYRQLRQEILSTLLYMKNSGVYKEIDVNMGVFTSTDIIEKEQAYIEDNLLAKKSHIIRQIEKLKSSRSIEEVNKVRRDIYHDQAYVKEDLFPTVVITGKQKHPIYATLLQQIDKHGMGAFKTKVGIRNIFLFLDRLQFSYEKAISRYDAHNYGVKWAMPYKDFSNIGVDASYNFHRLFRGLDHGVSSFSAFYAKSDLKVDLEVSDRLPSINTVQNPYDYEYVKADFMRPSKKKSIKLWKVLTNTLTYSDIVDGQYLDIAGEVALPISRQDARFFKIDLNYRKYIDMFGGVRGVYNHTLRSLLRYSNLELAVGMSGIIRGTNYVSDCLPALTARGFETPQTPNISPLNLKAALKYNVYNFPLLSKANIRVFAYLSNAISFDRVKTPQRYTIWQHQLALRSALGFGAFYEIAPFARLELMYNFMQYQNISNCKLANFQIRIGIND